MWQKWGAQKPKALEFEKGEGGSSLYSSLTEVYAYANNQPNYSKIKNNAS